MVQAYFVRKAAFDFVDLQNVDEEFGQLERLLLECLEAFAAVQVLFVMMSHHRRAASRRADDVFVLGEEIEKLLRQWASLFGQARVGHWLAATGLLGRHDDVATETLQQIDRGQADIRVELVDIARDEKCNLHSSN